MIIKTIAVRPASLTLQLIFVTELVISSAPDYNVTINWIIKKSIIDSNNYVRRVIIPPNS